jgi:hypothetical protein
MPFVLFARFSTSGCTGIGVAAVDTSFAGDISVGAIGFAVAAPVPAASAASDTANGNRNERFFMSYSAAERSARRIVRVVAGVRSV